VLAAVALAERATDRTSPTRRAKAVRAAMVDVSGYLGNTPTVARGSYVDPRVIDAYEQGATIAPTLQRLGTRRHRDPERSRHAIERAVLRLLDS
jgi:DNA topoisomerase IB